MRTAAPISKAVIPSEVEGSRGVAPQDGKPGLALARCVTASTPKAFGAQNDKWANRAFAHFRW